MDYSIGLLSTLALVGVIGFGVLFVSHLALGWRHNDELIQRMMLERQLHHAEDAIEELRAEIRGMRDWYEGNLHDGQPDEAQEWHDFDPDC